MKRKLISAVLVTVMAAGMLTGCSGKNSSIKNNVKTLEKEELKVSNAQLSSPDYEFEKEYAYGDFNAHSKADAERQDGIDTFEDKDIVFQDISYDQLIQLLGQEGNYLIQLSGSWCHNSRAMSPYVNAYAKEYGIDTIYSYDFNVDNGDDGSMFVRMSKRQLLEQNTIICMESLCQDILQTWMTGLHIRQITILHFLIPMQKGKR